MDDVVSLWRTPKGLRHFNIKAIRPLSGGLSNRCWLLSIDNQLSVWRPSSSLLPLLDISREQEAEILSLLRMEYWAPSPLHLDNAGLLVTYLEGEPFQGDITMAMPLLARIHQYQAPTPAMSVLQRAEHYWRSIRHPSEALKTLRAYFFTISEPPPLATVLCHLDFGSHNLIMTSSGIAIIDWEFATTACPALDLAMTAQSEMKDPLELIRAYASVSPFSERELAEKVISWWPWCQYLGALWYCIAGEYWKSPEMIAEGECIAVQLLKSTH